MPPKDPPSPQATAQVSGGRTYLRAQTLPSSLLASMAGIESPSTHPFLASPRGIVSPKSFSQAGYGSPVELLTTGLTHNRNELVLLFSR